MPGIIYYSLENLMETAIERYDVHTQNALTFQFDPALPHDTAELQAYLKADRARKKLLDKYYETETPYVQAHLKENEKNRYNMIRLRTIMDTVGDDNDYFKEVFVRQYAFQTVEMLYNDFARGVHAKTDDLKFRLPETRPELKFLAIHLKSWRMAFEALASYIFNHPDITAHTPLFDQHHNLHSYAPPAHQSFYEIAHDCMLHDFREGHVDLNQVSALLGASIEPV